VQAGSTSEQNLLFDVINERYNNRLPTLLLSNLTQAEVVAVLGERVIDRLREDGGKVITFDWQSARKNNG
jgi:DNA replication protein DnaC